MNKSSSGKNVPRRGTTNKPRVNRTVSKKPSNIVNNTNRRYIKTMFYISIILIGGFVVLWIFTPYIGIIREQRTFSSTVEDIHETVIESAVIHDDPLKEWDVIHGSPVVVDELDGRFFVANVSGSTIQRTIPPFDNGWVEFWMSIQSFPSNGSDVLVQLLDENDVVVEIVVMSDGRLTTNGQVSSGQLNIDEWYRVSIPVGMNSPSTFGDYSGPKIETPFNIIRLTGNACFDHVGVTSDGYTVGDNEQGQFLLSFSFEFNLRVRPFIEHVEYVEMIINCYPFGFYTPQIFYDSLTVTSDIVTDNIMGYCDDVITKGNTTILQFTRYKDILIGQTVFISMNYRSHEPVGVIINQLVFVATVVT